MLAAYADGQPLSNAALYETLAEASVIPPGALLERIPVGQAKCMHSPIRRKVRWLQQSARKLGLIERVPGERGVWRSTTQTRSELTPAPRNTVLLGFSTNLGLALWGDCVDAFSRLNEPIHLVLTSPPYCLRRARAYGGPTETEFVDFLCASLEPLIKNMAAGANLVLNVSNDIWMHRSPARSLYRERLVLALYERFGLQKMDTLVVVDPTKAPGPIAWASKERMQLHVGYEPWYVFCLDPLKSLASNQRVLLPHTETHLKFIANGGEKRLAEYGDGANKIRPGAFSKPTAGRIPTNVITMPHRCRTQDALRKYVKAEGLPTHGATFPVALAKFFIEWLTEKGQMVAEPFAGWFSGPLAAELTERRWTATEKALQYIEGARYRFNDCAGYSDAHKIG